MPKMTLACCWCGPLPRKRTRAKQVPLAEAMLHGLCRSGRLPLLCTQSISCLHIVRIFRDGLAARHRGH